MRAILYLLLLLIPFGLVADSLDVVAMSFNIRMNTPIDGKNAWPKRKDWVASIIQQSGAGIVGLQEVKQDQKQDLIKQLKGYGHYGVGRDDGKDKGEHCLIFYKTDLYTVLDSGTFWLSKKLHNPGSKSWDAAITRICSWVKLEEKATGRQFYFFNSHFDHKGEEARYYSILLIKKQIREMTGGLPVIVVGDFNFTPESLPYKEINTDASGYVLYDCFERAKDKTGEHTCCGFDATQPPSQRIDYILVNNAISVQQYQVITVSKKGCYPSDHLPVLCKVRF